LLLHELGKDQRHKGITAFAKALQEKGHAVLTFDFRGHGESTEVDANEFWSNRFFNRALIRRRSNDEIDFKDFDARYYGVLANDIAAARAFLDRRNDAGECNSSNLVVVGFERGATLGALWLNAEAHRYQLVPPQFFNQPPQISSTPEVKKVLCGIWFSIDPKLGNRTVALPSLVHPAGADARVPMIFLYGDKDDDGKRNAAKCEKALLAGGKLPFTAKAEVPGGGTRQGADLLKKNNIGSLLDYIENVHDDREAEWTRHKSRQTQYVWRLPRGVQPANRMGEPLLNYNTFEVYLPAR
jgi:hypothetical protein